MKQDLTEQGEKELQLLIVNHPDFFKMRFDFAGCEGEMLLDQFFEYTQEQKDYFQDFMLDHEAEECEGRSGIVESGISIGGYIRDIETDCLFQFTQEDVKGEEIAVTGEKVVFDSYRNLYSNRAFNIKIKKEEQ